MPTGAWCWSGRRGRARRRSARLLAEPARRGVPRHRRRRRGRTGCRIADIFVEHGEAAFRELERAAVAAALAEHDGVLALGGGAVLDAATRAAARAGRTGRLPRRRASRTPASRVGLNRDRPLLLGNPRAQWLRAAGGAPPLYEEVATLHRRHRRPDPGRGGRATIVARPRAVSARSDDADHACAGPPPYDVVSAPGCSASCRRCSAGTARQVAVVHPRGAGRLAADAVRERCDRRGADVALVAVPDGEAAKTVDVAAGLWSLLGRRGFTRSDAVVGLGGGAATDLAGFVAATWLRGVPVVHVPTTLLGMVDAAVGGKTGINTARGQEPGRRLPPAGRRAVRPRPRWRRCRAADCVGGLAEVVKAGLHRRPGDPRAGRGRPGRRARPGRPVAPRAGRARGAGQGRRGRRADLREAGPARDPQLRAHARATRSSGSRGTAGGTARRSRSGWSSPPSWPALAGRLDDADVDRHRDVLVRRRLPTTYRRATAGRAARRRCGWTRRPAATAAVRRAGRDRPARPARGPGRRRCSAAAVREVAA